MASLAYRSRQPHRHPNQHAEAELKLTRDMRRRNPGLNMVELWHQLRQRGYTRRPKSLFRVMRKLGLFPSKVKKPAYTPNPYQHMTYPGQRIQVDVKVVPAAASQAMSCAYTNTQLLTSLHDCVFGRLPGTVHLFLRKFPEKVVRVTCPLGNPCGMRPDG